MFGRNGGTAGYSGSRTLGVFADVTEEGIAAAGALLHHDGVPAAMVSAFNGVQSTRPGAVSGSFPPCS